MKWGCGIAIGLSLASVILSMTTCGACIGGLLVVDEVGRAGHIDREAALEAEEQRRAHRMQGAPERVIVSAPEGAVIHSNRGGVGGILGEVPPGIELKVLDQHFEEPTETMAAAGHPGIRWWRVEHDGLQGWISELTTDHAKTIEGGTI